MRQENLSDLLRRNASLYPDRVALVCEQDSVTHGELLKTAARVGHAYEQAGVKRGDRVAVLARNSIGMVQALNACELFGFIAVPLNHRLADEELAGIVRDCSPALLVVDEEFLATSARICKSCNLTIAVLVIGDGSPWAESVEAAMARGREELRASPAPEDIAYIIYTSGSTGRPKGVMLSHGALIESGRLLASAAGVGPDSMQIVAMPLFHVGATAHRIAYLVSGGALTLHRKFDAERIVSDLAGGRVTDLHLAPTMLRSVLDAIGESTVNLGRLESVKYASSPIPSETMIGALRVFGPKLLQFYALTEAGGVGTVLHKFVHRQAMQGMGTDRLRSAGQPLLGCEIQLRRPDGRVCETDEEGEIWLRSDAMMSGYWNAPALTSEAIVDGWLRTGDVARLDSEHYLFIMDRLKDMIVSGGENIYSSEVERTLEAHPNVQEAAVIGIPDSHWGEAVHAFVVLHPNATQTTQDDLIDFCKQRLASYKKPRSIEFLQALPRLQHVQKIDKPALRKTFWQGSKRTVN